MMQNIVVHLLLLLDLNFEAELVTSERQLNGYSWILFMGIINKIQHYRHFSPQA